MATWPIEATDLHVEDTGGDLPVVLFLHGFLFDGRQFEAQVDALRDQYRCITIDWPGQGRSGRSRVGYSTDRLTALVIAALDQQGLSMVHLVGLSMGGFAAMRIAASRPDLVRSLSLINTSAGPHARRKFPRQLALAALTLAVGPTPAPLVAGIEAEMYGSRFQEDDASSAVREVWRRRWAECDRFALVQTLLGFMGRADFRAELGSIGAPTLIVAGEADASLPPVQSVEIHDRIAGSRLVVIPGAGHSSPIEAPEEVSRALATFLAQAALPG